MSYPTTNLAARVEVSTLCNAKCPQCARTDPIGLGKYDWLQEEWVSLEKFKSWFPPTSIETMRCFYLTGSFGDPITNPEILDIVSYIRSVSQDIKISINTNGSLKNEDFWLELAFIGGKNLLMTFTVDGINEEQHSKYRVNTSLQKTLKHMKLMSDFGICQIKTITILFDHNENDLEKIISLCKEHGAEECEVTESNRFQKRSSFKYEYNGQNLTLNQVKKHRTVDTPESGRKVRVVGLEYNKEKIVCDSIKRKTLHVNVNGDVYPCCYIGNEYTRGLRYGVDKGNIIASDKENNYPLISEFDNINLNNKPFHDIVKGKYYSHDLPESIKTYETAHQLCQYYCSY